MNNRHHIILASIGLLIILLLYLSSCQSNVSIQTAQYAVNGQKLYISHCQNCHGSKGEGLAQLYPPLNDNEYFKQNRAKLSCIIRYGMKESIVIHGKIYKNQMPANPQLTELDIAYILTYITTNFGTSDSIYSHNEVKEAIKACGT
ncbi:cytochrome c [Sphingobacterium olei]|uniref:Cytochrome c n=1 Tax=Sphingobacterium olei TaxID=2571155 RepID=A0A4U0P6V9_9SPHI|nr:cytochrome c [Sphingobacterium olei]TJZ63089.1 cytochrome c [Sphingobacterium olei]